MRGRSGIEQQRGARVMQLMRGDVQATTLPVLTQSLPTIAAVQRPVTVDKDVVGRCWAAYLKVFLQRLNPLPAQENNPVLQSLPLLDPCLFPGQIQII
jgi:hypothetical protein